MRLFYRIKRKFINTFFREQWSILVCSLDGKILAHIVPPRDRFWADPFPVEYRGRTFIFVEEQIGSGSGVLGYIELYPDLSHSEFVPILEKPYHLSFPNVFCIESSGEKTWYMIPESHENKTIDLYRAVSFPGEWTHEMTLLGNITAVDTAVFFYEKRWWLFTGTAGDFPLNGNLCAFYSDVFPSDRWTAHAQNPIVTGLGNSRMAGAVYFDGRQNSLMRPAQNCLGDYGKETNINRILELGPEVYREKTTARIKPERELHAAATHTINFSSSYMLRDIKTRSFSGPVLPPFVPPIRFTAKSAP